MRKRKWDELVLNPPLHLFLVHPSVSIKSYNDQNTSFFTPDIEHNKVFRDVPIIGFSRAKSSKDIFVRAKTPQIKNKGWCGPCKGPRCGIFKHFT